MNHTLSSFFTGAPEARRLFDSLNEIVTGWGDCVPIVTKSQISWRRRRAFAWAWRPGQYLGGTRPPLVLSLALRRRDLSRRWKEVTRTRPGWFIHHLELSDEDDIDISVILWITEAWELGGS